MTFAIEQGTFSYKIIFLGWPMLCQPFRGSHVIFLGIFLEFFWKSMLITCVFIVDRELITCDNLELSSRSVACIDSV